MKIRSAVPENGCLVFLWRTEKAKNKKNICKTYTHLPNRWLRKIATLARKEHAAATAKPIIIHIILDISISIIPPEDGQHRFT